MKNPDKFFPDGKKTPEYRTWNSIRYRCNNPNSKDYHLYGGRGIRVEWETYDEFLNDMGKRPEGYSIERRNNNKNYCKDNCYWLPFVDQSYNRRNILTPEDKYLVWFLRPLFSMNKIHRITGLSEGSVCNLLKDYDE